MERTRTALAWQRSSLGPRSSLHFETWRVRMGQGGGKKHGLHRGKTTMWRIGNQQACEWRGRLVDILVQCYSMVSGTSAYAELWQQSVGHSETWVPHQVHVHTERCMSRWGVLHSWPIWPILMWWLYWCMKNGEKRYVAHLPFGTASKDINSAVFEIGRCLASQMEELSWACYGDARR